MAWLAVGVGTALLYAGWVVWVPLLPTNLYVPLLDLGKITGYTWPSAGLYLSLSLVLYGFYAAGYALVRRGTASLPLILACAAFFCLELGLAYPATAVDIFGYIAHGRLLAFHQVNPLIVAPNTFAGDPIVGYLAYPSEPSQYGPLWVLLGGGLALAAHGNLLAEIALYKAIGAVAHLVGAAVIWRIARGLGASPAGARSSAYLYAWNPMLLWETVGNGHNDGTMVLFGLLAAWLLVAQRFLFVLPALCVGVLIKIPVAVLGPPLFVGAWRARRAQAIEGALLALALAAVVYRPFWEGPSTLTALRRTDLFTASFASVLRLWLAPSIGLADATVLARASSLGAFALLGLTCVWLATRAVSTQDLLRLAYFTLVGALLLATTWFQAWYVVWPFAIGAALPDPRRHLEVALLSLGGLLQYFVFIYVWVIGALPPGENVAVQSAAYLAVVGPLLVGLALRAALARRSLLEPMGRRLPSGRNVS